jgi:hypothetical protein
VWIWVYGSLLVLVSGFGAGIGRGEPPASGKTDPWEFVSWKPIDGNPVFKGTGNGTWDRKIRERGFILPRKQGGFDLWYTGYNDDRSPTRFLGHATSPDGLKWRRDPGNPLFTDSWVEDMAVIERDGTRYMFAEGKNDIAHLLSSRDGLRWTDLGPLDIRKVDGTPISTGPRGTPTPFYENGVWSLLYERGDRGVWLARSKDMQVWTNVRDEPVLGMGPEPYDSQAIAVNQIVKRNGYYYTFYHANAHRPWRDWTSCVARSKDLIHWEKYAGNPIVENNSSSPIVVETPQGDRLYTMHPEVRAYEPAKAASDQ